MSPAVAQLAEWGGYYAIVGSAAGALIGLQFVVLTLIAARPPVDPAAGAAFATPTIVHFGAALLLSALLRAPWHRLGPLVALLALAGLVGVAYSAAVARRMRTQTAYRPELEDWLLHAVLPLAAYATLIVAAAVAPSHTRGALFAVGAVALTLVFIGIHNAWDAVTYHLLVSGTKDEDGDRGSGA